MKQSELKKLLDQEVKKRDCKGEISWDKPDPLLVAREYRCEYIALVCALFSYGNAKAIVSFLSKLDFSLLDASDEKIRKSLSSSLYRFQSHEDIIHLFLTLASMKKQGSLEEIFVKGYTQGGVLKGIWALMESIYAMSHYKSQGYAFLIGSLHTNSPLKRWNMFLRWMVREDNLDMGLWKGVKKSDLIIPLDTHTFKVGKRLGLVTRKTYDLKAAIELTESLKRFDPLDPIKYDFALYRLGQEGMIR